MTTSSHHTTTSEVVQALEPFARYMDGGLDRDDKEQPLPDDHGVGWVYLTMGDFRRAGSAYAALTVPPPCSTESAQSPLTWSEVDQLHSRISELEVTTAQLREALEPFAKIGGHLSDRDRAAGLTHRAAFWDCPHDLVLYQDGMDGVISV